MDSLDKEKLLRELELSAVSVKKSLSGKPGESAEKAYGQAYWQCVKVGIKPPLRKKYR
jgi:hypothetical protein